MKTIISFLMFLASLNLFSQVNPNYHNVDGYYRSNGTYVEGYRRTNPNGTINDNYSTYPNVNPWTGRPGYIAPESYGSNFTFGNKELLLYGLSQRQHLYNVRHTELQQMAINFWDAYLISIKPYGNNIPKEKSDYAEQVNNLLLKYSTYDLADNYIWIQIRSFYAKHSKNLLGNASYTQPVQNTNNNPPPQAEAPRKLKMYHPYGESMGRLTIWGNFKFDGYVHITVDDTYAGTLFGYKYADAAVCGGMGTIRVDKSVGIHEIKVEYGQKAWKRTVTIKEDECLLYGLTLD